MSDRVALLRVCTFAVALLALNAVDAAARTIRLAWDASADTTVTGYRVYWSTQSGTYNDTNYFDVGDSLTWTGDLPGDQYYFAIRAYDAEGNLGPLSLEAGDTAAFWLSNPGDQSHEAGQAVDVPLVAHGAPVTYNGEGFPAGLGIDALSGHILGTIDPTVAFGAPYVVTARAVDAIGHVSSVQFYWTVHTNQPPIVTNPGDQINLGGDAVILPLSAFDPDGGSLRYSATSLPPGLTIDPTTGIISGSVPPTATGVFNASVSVSDGRLVTSVPFAWRISPAGALTVVRVISAEGIGSTVSTPPFSTTVADEVLIAFVEAAQPTTDGEQTAVVSGGGLLWSLVARANGQAGTAEIWSAQAPVRLSNATVTADVSIEGTFLSLTVVGFAAADGVGASAAASAAGGAPGVSLTTTRAGSFVFGAGNDWDGAVSRTIPGGQELVQEAFSTSGDTFWVQRLTGAIATGGTSVTLRDTAPTDHRWNLAAVEIRGRSQSAPGSLSIDDVEINEGKGGSSSMIFTVTLSAASPVPVTVQYATADGTAKAGRDYAARSGTLVFPTGVTRQTIAVPIYGDKSVEYGESFSVVLNGATNAVIADAQAVGTILNDDGTIRMFGFGAIVDGRLRNRFVFRLAERNARDYGRLEFWSSEPVKGKGVDDDDRPGHHDNDYGHDHRSAKNRFDATVISSVAFGPIDKKGGSVTFSGAGSWNGKSGFTFEAQATDRGEPGRGRDTFMLTVKDSRGVIVLKVNATLDEGNIQSTPASRR